MSRVGKQFKYGSMYVGILLLVFAGVYYGWLKPEPTCSDGVRNQGEEQVDCGGPCSTCREKHVGKQEPLRTYDAEFFLGGSDSIFFIGEVGNPNFDYGAKEFLYEFRLYDENGSSLNTFGGEGSVGPSKNVFVQGAVVSVAPKLVDRVELRVTSRRNARPSVGRRESRCRPVARPPRAATLRR